MKAENAFNENVGSRSESAGAYRDGYERAGKNRETKVLVESAVAGVEAQKAASIKTVG